MVGTHCGRLLILLTLLVVAGCKKTTIITSTVTSTSQRVADLFAAAPHLVLTADELGQEQNKDEQATQRKYKGKVIELSGIVRGMNRSLFLEPLIHLKMKGDSALYLRSTEPKPWDKISPGQHVKLKAMYLDDPTKGMRLVAGPILEITGKATPPMTADQLAKEFEANAGAAQEKFRSNNMGGLILTGTIFDMSNKSGTPAFSLKTGTKYTLQCGPGSGKRSRIEAWDERENHRLLLGRGDGSVSN